MCVCVLIHLCPTFYIYVSIYNYPAKGFPIAQWVKNLSTMQETGNVALIPEWEWSHGGGNGNPLQYSCLENPMDKRRWQDTVHGVTKSQTGLSD